VDLGHPRLDPPSPWRPSAALTLLPESAGKLPDNPQVQYHLGMMYAKLGDKDNARKALGLAGRLAPEL
jgi:Flp pilus assembly protein TadD